jgi:multidrug efflux pump subunit AcrA (membrane-fusion protein)
MTMKKIYKNTLFIVAFLLIVSCKNTVQTEIESMPVPNVKIALVTEGNIQNKLSLNGTTTYLQKNKVAAPLSGYIVKINKKFGDQVHKNEVLFQIQSKESRALENSKVFGNTIGIINVVAASNGFVNELTINETGGFVMEGEILCSIIDNTNVLVQVNVPFEYNQLVKTGVACELFLPDNRKLTGTVFRIVPLIDAVNQTQNVLIKLNTNTALPENLNVVVQFANKEQTNALLVPKNAILTDETQSEFWLLKLVDKKVIKIPISKGIENDSLLVINTLNLKINDTIIVEGGYGLEDGTEVKIGN